MHLCLRLYLYSPICHHHNCFFRLDDNLYLHKIKKVFLRKIKKNRTFAHKIKT